MTTKKDIQEALDLLIQALMRYSPCPKEDKKYYSRLRGLLRRLSIHWAEKHIYLNSIKQPYIGSNKRIKHVYPCQICKELFPRNKGEVDHITPCGSINKDEEIKFIKRMFCNRHGFRFLCVACHQKITHRKDKS